MFIQVLYHRTKRKSTIFSYELLLGPGKREVSVFGRRGNDGTFAGCRQWYIAARAHGCKNAFFGSRCDPWGKAAELRRDARLAYRVRLVRTTRLHRIGLSDYRIIAASAMSFFVYPTFLQACTDFYKPPLGHFTGAGHVRVLYAVGSI